MKKLKINIAIVAILLGVSSAFAFKPSKPVVNRFATNYYAVADSPDGSTWHWVATQPTGLVCDEGKATCEISTTIAGTPPSNGFPSSYTVQQGLDKKSVYNN